MIQTDFLTQEDPVKKWVLWGIPVLSIAGSLMHFVYEWTGNSVIAGIFAPVNESVWEHLKLVLWPSLIWWLAGYIILYKKSRIITFQWFFSSAVAELTYPAVIIAFFYSYTGALGIESLVIDIFSFFLAVAAGQALALHVYKYASLRRSSLFITIFILLSLVVVFTVFTFKPPLFPILRDSVTGKYGI